MYHLQRFTSLVIVSLLISACGVHKDERYGLGSVQGVDNQKQTQREQMISAIEADNVVTVEDLLKEGYEINMIILKGQTALHVAVIRNRAKIVRILFGAKGDPDAKDQDGRSPRDLAEGKPEILAIFNPGSELKLQEELMLAIRDGDKAKLTNLIGRDQRDPNFIDVASGETPLTYIIANKLTTLLRPMLQGSARTDVNLKNREGKSPLKLARETEQTDVEKMLLQKGAKEN